MTSLLINILHRLFRCRYSNSRDVVASSPSFSCPPASAPGRACSKAMMTLLGGGLAPSRDQIIPQLVAYRKVTTIAYESWSFTRVSNCSELILQNFSILGWRWSGARDGCKWRFDCSQFSSSALMERITFTANDKRRQIQVENF